MQMYFWCCTSQLHRSVSRQQIISCSLEPSDPRRWIVAVFAKRPDINAERLRGVAAQMDRAVPECEVTGFESLISSLVLPDPGDRHVLAAAIACHADCIVTFNQRDFPHETLAAYSIRSCHPDCFLLEIAGLDSEAFLTAIQDDCAHYKRPPLSVDEYIARFRQAGVGDTADYLSRSSIFLQR